MSQKLRSRAMMCTLLATPVLAGIGANLTSCRPNSPTGPAGGQASTLVLVFPREFRGLAKVCRSDGAEENSTPHARIEFDLRGRAVEGSLDPLLRWASRTAQFNDGTALPLWSEHNPPTASESLGVWQGGSPLGPNECVYFFVGTAADRETFEREVLREALGPGAESLIPDRSSKE